MMFKLLNTRSRIVILSIVLSILFIIMQEISFRELLGVNWAFDPIKALVLSFITYIGTYWILFFKVKGERFITVLMFPSMVVFGLALLSELISATVFSDIGHLSVLVISATIFGFIIYLTLLTINILNTAYLEEIPLGQAARAAHYILSMIIAYITFFLIFSYDLFIPLRAIIAFGVVLLIVYMSLWTIKLRLQRRLIASLNISLLVLFVVLILSIWPVSTAYIALILSVFLYICLGISLEIRETISSWIWVEYVSLFFLLITLLLLVAEWGINGILI